MPRTCAGSHGDQSDSRQEVGVYFMVHWTKSTDPTEHDDVSEWNEQMTQDWTKTNLRHLTFSTVTVYQIENFGKSILKGLGFNNPSRNTHSLAPGVFYTARPDPQGAHLDFDETNLPHAKKSWILHMPLQKEGMLLSVWDLPVRNQGRDVNALHEYVFIPFGSYIALRSDVLHSGVYGPPGNTRFHMILKSRNKVQVAAKPGDQIPETQYSYPLPVDDNRPPWKPVFLSKKKCFRFYTDLYVGQLQEDTGNGFPDSLLKCSTSSTRPQQRSHS